MESQYLKCDCNTSNSQIITRDIDKFSAKTIYQSFKDTLKYSNYKVLLCYKLPFRINSITTNIGSIFIIIFFLVYLIFLIIFCIKGQNNFKAYINDEMVVMNNDNIEIKKISTEKFKTNNRTKRIRNRVELNSRRSSTRKELKNNIQIFNILQFPPRKNSFLINRQFSKNKTSIQKTRNILHKKLDNDNSKKSLQNMDLKLKQNTEMEKNIKNEGNTIEIQPDMNKNNFNSFEINNIYNKSLNEGKHNFFEIYCQILRKKHLILFTFFARNDYNFVYIKIDRFIFLVCSYMVLNVFFFSDETMHKIHLDYGKYNFIQQIPQITYSALITQILDISSYYLIFTEKNFYEINNLKQKSRNKIIIIINV